MKKPAAASAAATTGAAQAGAAQAGAATTEVREPRRRGTVVIAGLALAWLAATMWAAHATILGSGDSVLLALTRAALSLPSLIVASLLAGGAVGLLAMQRLAGRVPVVRTRTAGRYVAGLAGAAPVGLAGGALVLAGYGTSDPILVLAAAVASASLLGGVLAGTQPAPVVAAGFAGLLGWFAVGLLQGLFRSRLLSAFGTGSTVASWQGASNRLTFAIAVAGGLLCGLVAYAYLRRTRASLRWPAYLVAGGGAGVLLLVADIVTLVGGAQLLRLAASLSPEDRAVIAYLSESRMETGLIVFFAGALAALIAFGRTLRAPDTED
jgi:hypothetical protein